MRRIRARALAICLLFWAIPFPLHAASVRTTAFTYVEEIPGLAICLDLSRPGPGYLPGVTRGVAGTLNHYGAGRETDYFRGVLGAHGRTLHAFVWKYVYRGRTRRVSTDWWGVFRGEIVRLGGTRSTAMTSKFMLVRDRQYSNCRAWSRRLGG